MIQRRHFPLFDSIRAISVLAVIVAHSSLYAGIGRPGSALWPYVERLDVAVPVFLLISGFLLYRPFAVARLQGDQVPPLSSYGWQRVARIFPGYWVALTVSALWLGLSDVLTPGGIPIYYGFGQIYSASTMAHGIPQAWTLGIEVAFYAFLPAWVLMMRRIASATASSWMRRELLALAVLAGASLIYKVVLLSTGAVGELTPALVPSLTALPAYLDMFAVGMALAVVSVAWEARGRLPALLAPIDRFPGLSWLIAGVAFLYGAKLGGISGHAPGGYTHSQYLERHYLNVVIAATLMLPAIFGDQSQGFVRRVLALRPLAYIGTVSYGLYLYHELILAKLHQWGYGSAHVIHPYVSWFLGALVVTLIPASASWYLLERPALRLRGRLARRQAAAAGPADPAASSVATVR